MCACVFCRFVIDRGMVVNEDCAKESAQDTDPKKYTKFIHFARARERSSVALSFLPLLLLLLHFIFPVLFVIIIIVVIKGHHCVCKSRFYSCTEFFFFAVAFSVVCISRTSRDWFSLVSLLLCLEFCEQKRKKRRDACTRSLCAHTKIVPFAVRVCVCVLPRCRRLDGAPRLHRRLRSQRTMASAEHLNRSNVRTTE